MGGDTVTVDIGFVKLGVPFKLPHDTTIKAYNNGTIEGTGHRCGLSLPSATGKTLACHV